MRSKKLSLYYEQNPKTGSYILNWDFIIDSVRSESWYELHKQHLTTIRSTTDFVKVVEPKAINPSKWYPVYYWHNKYNRTPNKNDSFRHRIRLNVVRCGWYNPSCCLAYLIFHYGIENTKSIRIMQGKKIILHGTYQYCLSFPFKFKKTRVLITNRIRFRHENKHYQRRKELYRRVKDVCRDHGYEFPCSVSDAKREELIINTYYKYYKNFAYDTIKKTNIETATRVPMFKPNATQLLEERKEARSRRKAKVKLVKGFNLSR
jgi:hypothetical protein